MRQSETPIHTDIVLIGGGHAHVTVVKRFGMKPIPGVRLTLISPDAHTPYSGMLPGLIAGHYTYDEAHIDLVRLCRFAGARYFAAEIDIVDPDRNAVHCAGRPPIPFDFLSVNAGSTPDPNATPGASGHVIPVKPVATFLERWQQLRADVLAKPHMRIGLIGAGAGGVELALSAHHALDQMLASTGQSERPVFSIVTRGPEILETHNATVRASLRRLLAGREIRVETNFNVDQVDGRAVVSGDRKLEFDRILWVTGAEAPTWIARSGLAVDRRDFMAIDNTLRSISHPNIFGAGDCASIVDHPRPKSGVFAVRQGPPLTRNLRSAVLGRPLRRYRPQRLFLSLISTGNTNAVASWGRFSVQGEWVWRIKDRIDRAFMEKFNDLPDMTERQAWPAIVSRAGTIPTDPERLASDGMRCGGCGAKVGSSTVSRVLHDLNHRHSDDVVVGLDSPDDAAVLEVPGGQRIVQTVDMFRTMIDDPFVFAMIAANHALNDLYAMGSQPKWALAIATLPFASSEKTEATLSALMAGAVRVLDAADCALVGGHTSEGSELAIGFSVTGVLASHGGLRKAGMKPGDRLIITKPLGTGVIFAADMRAKAKGRWVQGAIESALLSNRDAASIFATHRATACTDVTGFGLAGHLLEMADASQNSAVLGLESIPVLDGVDDCLDEGIVSSLYAENVKAGVRVAGSAASEQLAKLLFDPQTAGGLLASVPEEEAHACLSELHAKGYCRAAIIGVVVEKDAATDAVIEVVRALPASIEAERTRETLEQLAS